MLIIFIRGMLADLLMLSTVKRYAQRAIYQKEE